MAEPAAAVGPAFDETSAPRKPSRHATILAGGKGTRLKERLNGRPKPLVDVEGRPLLARQLDQLATYGIGDVLLLVNHARDKIETFCAERNHPWQQVVTLDDGEPRGTAGALLAAFSHLADQMFVIYGDTLFDIDLDRLLAHHQAHDADVTLLVHPNDHPADSDLVEVDADDWVTRFHGYPHPPGAYLANLVNAALYVVKKKALAAWEGFRQPSDIAKDLLPAMLDSGARIKAYRTSEYIKDIGTPSRLDRASGHLRTGLVARSNLKVQRAAVFLDRDGTLNAQRGHIANARDLDLLPGVGEALKRLRQAEYLCIVITNQPVIARGDCDFAEMARIHAKLETLLGASGAYLDAIYLCPHHPDSGFRGEVASLKIRCDCRKPGTLMFQQACEAFNIDIGRSWMIGDSHRDVDAAHSLGLRSILLKGGEWDGVSALDHEPLFVADDLVQAVDRILEKQP